MKKWIKSGIVVFGALIICSMETKSTIAEEKTTKTNNNIMTVDIFANYDQLISKLKKTENKNSKQEETRPQIDNSPLNGFIQQYIYDKSKESGFGYTYLLAIISTESQFNKDEVSDTHDIGLMQLNVRTSRWIAKQLGVEDYNMKNEKQNIDFGVYYLSYIRDYWKSIYPDISDEELFDLTTIAFNRGIEGTKQYLKHHGTEDNQYLRAVLHNKNLIEQGDVS